MMKRDEELENKKIREHYARAAKVKEHLEKQEQKENIADRVIRENLEKIEKYPELHIHNDASIEVKKLYGTLNYLDQEYWTSFDKVLKDVYPSLYSGPRLIIESRMLELARPSTSGVPPSLGSYIVQFQRFPRDHSAIEREEKRCLVAASFLLHMIFDETENLLNTKELKPEETIIVEKIKNYVHIIIEDFRLKDLKEKRI